MDKVLDILQSARKNGISISLDKDQLSIKYSKGMNIDSKLIEEIKDNKELIIDFLSNKSKVKKSHGYENKITHIAKYENQNIPLSFSQERLWFWLNSYCRK